jgi:hypothetical protein
MFGRKQPPPIRLRWEWPAGRTPTDQFVIRIDELTEESAGPFGLKASASIATRPPDPVNLRGTVLAGGAGHAGTGLTLVLPRDQVTGVVPGDELVLKVTSGDVCICVEKRGGAASREGAADDPAPDRP